MLHGSLFSGIGGFDLAAEWMGWENAFHCETNPFCQKVLQYYWPGAASYEDITQTDFSAWRNRIDVLTGGFPCQPYSHLGKRRGKDDERHLWPSMLRAIREIQPRYVVGENVPGIITWHEGLVFDEVHADLEAENYSTVAFVLPAAAVNAPHRRERVWFISSKDALRGGRLHRTAQKEKPALRKLGITRPGSRQRFHLQARPVADPAGGRWEVGDPAPVRRATARAARYAAQDWSRWPVEPPVCPRDDGFPGELDGITFPTWRMQSVQGAGNAIVPQVALRIFKAIEKFDREDVKGLKLLDA